MKYKKTKLVNYRQQRDNLNILETCTFIGCDQYRTNYDGHIDITRRKRSLGIQYKHKSKEDIAGFISKPELGLSMELYISIKVCYYKIFTVDIYILLLSYHTRFRTENTGLSEL